MKFFTIQRKHKRFLTLLLSSLLIGSLIAGCSTSDNGGAGDEDTLARAQREGYVTVGFAQERPYAYQNENGELTGEAVEVARSILSKLGIEELRGELTEFGSLIPGLNAGRYDMVTAGMFITPDRAQEALFANPEYSIGEAIAVKTGNPLSLHSYEDIAANSAAKVAVPAGAIEYDYLIASGVAEEQIVVVPDIAAALAALQADRADAFTATGPAVQAALETSNAANVERVEDFTQPMIDGESVRGYGATVFRQSDQRFVDVFNEGLEELKASGELLEILEHFGFTADELPGDVTTQDLVG